VGVNLSRLQESILFINQKTEKMKYRHSIFGLLAMIFVLATIIGCTKEKTPEQIASGDKVVLSELDLSFVPEGDPAENMQVFFDAVNDYMAGYDTFSNTYSISEGIWYLLTGINYTSANLLAQISEMEEITFTHEIELAEDIPAGLSATGVISAFLGFHEDLQSLQETGYDIGLIRFDTITTGDTGVLVSLSALRGKVVEYPDVESNSPPVPLPPGPNLKMGVPYNGYKSAAHETEDKYNPYLYKSKIDQLQLVKGYFLVSGISGHYPDLWTDGNNCYQIWDPANQQFGDYILTVACPTQPYQNNPTHLNAQVTVTIFNTYLERFYQRRLTGYIQDNISFGPQKWLYTKISINWLPECTTCGYQHFPWKKAVFAFTNYRGKVETIINPINTYTL
jgi:hypothetical protein